MRRPEETRVLGREVTWSAHWETALATAEHLELTRLLASSYVSNPAFAGGHSWAGARPELRVVGRRHGGAVAHAGIVARLLRVAHDGAVTAQLVGDVGLVAVCPGQQGEGLGVALMDAVAATLARLELPFGFLTCGPALRPFYQRCGWTALTDRVLRAVTLDQDVEEGRRGMVLGVRSPVSSWPPGTVERNGQEI